MSPAVEPFEVVVHEAERILEVRYPPHPTLEAYEAYDRQVRAAIRQLKVPWDCLVDQSALRTLPPEFPARIAALNHWAREHGMRKTARVVDASAVAALQTQRILRESGTEDIGTVFQSREAAWSSLNESGRF